MKKLLLVIALLVFGITAAHAGDLVLGDSWYKGMNLTTATYTHNYSIGENLASQMFVGYAGDIPAFGQNVQASVFTLGTGLAYKTGVFTWLGGITGNYIVTPCNKIIEPSVYAGVNVDVYKNVFLQAKYNWMSNTKILEGWNAGIGYRF